MPWLGSYVVEMQGMRTWNEDSRFGVVWTSLLTKLRVTFPRVSSLSVRMPCHSVLCVYAKIVRWVRLQGTRLAGIPG